MDVEKKIKREIKSIKTKKSCQIMMKLSDLWLFILIYTTKFSLKNKIKIEIRCSR